MKWFDAFLLAFKGIAAHKMRSSLSMLGIIIGVMAVVALMSIGNGAQASIVSYIEDMGSNMLHIMPGKLEEAATVSVLGRVHTLTLEDAYAIEDARIPSVESVVPVVEDWVLVGSGREKVITQMEASTPRFIEVYNWPLQYGEPFTDDHVAARAQVCILGASLAKTLFGDADPIGEQVKVNNVPFRVMGVLESKGALMMVDTDDVVLVPINTAKMKIHTQRTPQGGRTVTTISIRVSSEKDLDAVRDEVTELLRHRHRLAPNDENDFTIMTNADFVELIGEVLGILTILLGSIAGISLLVGGVGIMNIMLVSVTERTREIGIRKAVGAKRRDILVQFLIEAAALSLTGGAMGVLVGWGIAGLFNLLSHALNLGFEAQLSLDAVVLAFTISAAIGIFFGLYPATRAARLHPIEALRYE